MRPVRGFDDWPAGPLHLTIGVFDGVHAGHRALVGALAEGARRAGATAVAATFDPLPVQILAPDLPPSALSDAGERAALLREAGATTVVVFPFDSAFAALSAPEFVGRMAASGEVRHVLVGDDFQFGRGREGDVAALRTLGESHGFTVAAFAPVSADGAVISSTRIRACIAAGAVTDAARLLARPYSVNGVVVAGARRGRTLGWPTLNVRTPPDRLLPADGIYAGWASVGGARHAAAISLGVRPTFGGGDRQLEAYLLDFDEDVYGHEAEIAFVERLRDEERFESVEALTAQIEADVRRTRAILA